MANLGEELKIVCGPLKIEEINSKEENSKSNTKKGQIEIMLYSSS